MSKKATLEIKGTFKPNEEELMIEMIEGLKQATQQVSDAVIDIKIRRRVDDAMGDIKNVTRVIAKEEAIESILDKESEELNEREVDNGNIQVDVKHEEGQIILVFFWSTANPFSKATIKQYQQMLEKNKSSWNGRVRIVALSTDSTIEVVREYVE